MLQTTAPFLVTVPLRTAPHPADSGVTYICQTEQARPTPPENSPWSVWGPALVALFGVLITLTAKWIQDRRAAKHDLRRELLLKVADAITDSSVLMGTFGQTTSTLDDLRDLFLRCIRPLNQAETIADTPLLTAMMSFKNELGLAFGKLIRIRLPMERHLLDVAVNKPLIEETSAEIKAILAEQSRLALDGVRTDNDQARYQRLQQRFDFLQQTRTNYFNSDTASHDAVRSVVIDVSRSALAEQLKLIGTRVQVLGLIRSELGFKFDLDAYTREQTAMAEAAIADFRKSVDRVDEVFRQSDENT